MLLLQSLNAALLSPCPFTPNVAPVYSLYFLFYILDALAPIDPGDIALPRLANFWGQQRTPLRVWLSHANQPIQSLHLPITLFIRVPQIKPTFLCLNHPKARNQTTQNTPYIPEPTEMIQTSSSYIYLALVCLPHLTQSFLQKNTIKLLPMLFPHSLWLLINPGASSPGPAWSGMHPPFGNCE